MGSGVSVHGHLAPLLQGLVERQNIMVDLGAYGRGELPMSWQLESKKGEELAEGAGDQAWSPRLLLCEPSNMPHPCLHCLPVRPSNYDLISGLIHLMQKNPHGPVISQKAHQLAPGSLADELWRTFQIPAVTVPISNRERLLYSISGNWGGVTCEYGTFMI